MYLGCEETDSEVELAGDAEVLVLGGKIADERAARC